ncbi:MAG: TlpA family protein disulfide reductase [Nitrospiraceae bacterium]|nr:MAG: TlpA family protein disulfide reductase [Nitrospiraceae bacterium]
MPSLESLNQSFKGEDFAILSIDIEEPADTVQKLVEQHGLTFENLLDEKGEVSALYGVRSTPMKFIIDSRGNLVGAALGYREWDNEDMKQLVRLLIDQD